MSLRVASAFLIAAIAACAAEDEVHVTVTPTTLTLREVNSLRIAFEEDVLDARTDERETVEIVIGGSSTISWPAGDISRVEGVSPRVLEVLVIPPLSLGDGPFRLDGAVARKRFSARLTRAILLASPDGLGFCCPSAGGDCNEFRPGGWVLADDPTRCEVIADAAGPIETITDEHGCTVFRTDSCLGG